VVKIRDYVNLRYKPGKNDLVAEYYVEPNKVSLEKAACNIAGESSIDSWSDLKTLKPKIFDRLRPNVFYIDKKAKIIRISYPQELFEEGNMPQILSSIAGNVFGMKIVSNLRLLDLSFPKKLAKSFMGPFLGIPGIRKISGVDERFFIGTIIKPKLGLSPKEHSELAYKCWVGGMDVVKDDENLTSMNFNDFYERIRETVHAKFRAEDKTGEKKFYMPNITSESKEMIRRAEYVEKQENDFMMIDILTAGFSALQTLRQANFKLGIHAHRAMHASMTRNPRQGISMRVIGEVARMIGVDTLHIGAFGKMEGTDEEILGTESEIEDEIIKKGKIALEEDWYGKKPVLAVASGGLHPGMLENLHKKMGNNVLYQFGAGVHAHKNGTESGAVAVRQAAEAIMEGVKVSDYAKVHKELSTALQQWGSK
jgi:ribulose-bisphosphate carboxylase large chain